MSDFKLPGVDGKQYSLQKFAAYKALVIIFMCSHCPYVTAVIQRLIDMQQEVLGKGVRLVGINCNDAIKYPDDSFVSMLRDSKGWGMNFPYLFDESQEVAKKYDAVCTPDIYVYGTKRILLYRGRIDDNWDKPDKVSRRDLKQAIDNILSNRNIAIKQIPSIGCSIKWKTT